MKKKFIISVLACLTIGIFSSKSVQATNKKEWKLENNKWVYVDSNNLRSKSWEKINGDWFYFNSTGEMQEGWQYINKSWYHLRDNGVMDTGWRNIGGEWYYFNSSGGMVTGWKYIGKVWYHFRDNGVMDKGWREIGGFWYYFDKNGTMETGWKYINKEWYHLKDNGPMDVGLIEINKQWFYLNNTGIMNTGWKSIDGKWHHFDENGVMNIGWKKILNKWYYFNYYGEMVSNKYVDGWRLDKDGIGYYEKSFRNPKLENSSQVILVTTNNMSTSYCNINIYQKDNGKWNNIDTTTGRVGLNGLEYIDHRVQSTNTTPAGVMSIIGAFGVNDNPGTKMQYIKVKNDMYWDLNSNHSTYNRLVNYNPGGDYEHLKSYPRQYEYSLITDYNYNQVPNKGGAIFIHCLGRGATGGCISMSKEKIVEILKWIDPKKNPKILVIPQYDLNQYWY